MTPRRQLRLAVVALLAALPLLAAGPAAAQDPRIPFAPRDMSLCDRLDAEWQALHGSLAARHDSCLESARQARQCNLTGQEDATCSCAPCEALHRERDRVAADRGATVRECRMTVREYEAEVRRREAEERRRQEEQERQRQEEERRLREEQRQREEAEETRRREQEQEDRDREADDRAREAEERERQRADDAERSRVNEENQREAERALREQMERDARMLDQAAEMSQYEHQAMEARNAQREEAAQRLSEENGAAAAQSEREAEGIAQQASGTLGRLAQRAAQAITSRPSGGTESDFDFDAAGPEDGGPDLTGMAIDGLVNLGRSAVPFATVPLEMIRGVMHQNSRTIDAIATAIENFETTDGSELEAAIDGYRTVLSPSRYVRILAEEAADDGPAESVGQALSQAVQDRLTETLDGFRSRVTRGFLDTPPAEPRTHWYTGKEGGDGQVGFLPIVERTASELADAAGNWLVGRLVGAAADAWEGTP